MKIGDRVILISERHGVDNSNPVYEYKKVIGTISDIKTKAEAVLNIRVDWDNTRSNIYAESDLQLYDKYNSKDVYTIEEDLKLLS